MKTPHRSPGPTCCVSPATGDPGERAPQAVKFLNNPHNRELLQGVIGAGNTNFGDLFCVAADKVAAKCHVPVLYKFELMGTEEDVETVQEGLEKFWIQNSLYPASA